MTLLVFSNKGPSFTPLTDNREFEDLPEAGGGVDVADVVALVASLHPLYDQHPRLEVTQGRKVAGGYSLVPCDHVVLQGQHCPAVFVNPSNLDRRAHRRFNAIVSQLWFCHFELWF